MNLKKICCLALVLVGAASSFAQSAPQAKSKRGLFILSEYGYWGEELIGPMEALEGAGYKIDFATPKGTKPMALPPSMDVNYIDPPLGKKVTTAEMAAKVKKVEESDKLDKPINLTEWMPAKPYLSSSTYLDDLFGYNRTLDKIGKEITGKYDALVIVGGSGPILDVANNKRVQDLIRLFIKGGKPVVGICYGVAAIAFTRDEITDKSAVYGKRVTRGIRWSTITTTGTGI